MWSGERAMANINLTSAVNKLLKEYGDEINSAVEEVLPKVAKDTVNMLKQTSPKRSGAYAKDWALEKWRTSANYTGVTIFNRGHYHLTHLLEFGHAKRNGGRVKAEPHIADAEQFAINELIAEVERKVKGI